MADPLDKSKLPPKNPDAGYVIPREEQDKSSGEETVDEIKKMGKRLEDMEHRHQEELRTLRESVGRGETKVTGPDPDKALASEEKRLQSEYVATDSAIVELDRKIAKAMKAEDVDDSAVADLQRQKRSLESKQRRIEADYESFEKRVGEGKQSREDQKNRDVFMGGVQNAVRRFPELSDGKGGLNVNSPLYHTAKMILDENAQPSRFAKGLRPYINPDFDHANGFYYAVLEAKTRLGSGGSSGGKRNSPDLTLSGGQNSGAGNEEEFDGVTLTELKRLRKKSHDTGDAEVTREWARKSRQYELAKERASRRR